MNSSIALRLLWKEYRVQRGLWLSMAGGSIALQALIAFLVPSDQESFQGIVPVAFMLTGFYAIGSGAITFAIEREEGTQLRPVMLGCPPGLTLTVKILFGIVTTALLIAVTMSSGMLLSLGSLTLPENIFRSEVQGMIVPLALLFVALPYLGCLLWSTFFSLLTRKVIVALGLAAIAMIGSYIVVAITSIAMFENAQRHQSHHVTGPQLFAAALVPCLLAALLLALNYLLTHRWLTRAFFDQTSAKSPSFFKRWRIRRSGFDGGMVVEIGVEDRTAFEVVSAEVAAHQPPPRFGLSLLYAMWGPNLWRHLRFLRWREAIETRKLFVGFLLVTLVFTLWCVTENPHSSAWQGVVAFFIHAACVACGAMAFRTEQDERKVQRLADMGLRPATVWLSKHLVWFTRALMSIVAILICVLFVEFVYSYLSSRMRVAEFFHGTWLNLQLPNGSVPNDDSGFRLIGRAFILTLTMYGIGQVCSQLIRSTIVSMFVSFILGLTAFGWAAVCWYFSVPFVLSVLPLAIGCLLVTWCRTKSWMIDDNRGRAWVWPTAAITVAVALIYSGTGLFRVYEIPWSKPFFSDGSSAEFDDGLTDEQRAFVLAPVSDDERDTFQKYQRAADLLGKNRLDQRSGEKTIEELWQAVPEENRPAIEEAIRRALEASASPACAEFNPATTNIAEVATSKTAGTMQSALDLVLYDARREIENGNLDNALDRFRSALAVSRHAAGRGSEMNWWSSHWLTNQTLAAIQEWAKHPVVNAELVEEATNIIDEHRKQMMPVEVTNFATAVMIRNTLEADAFAIAELADQSERLPMLLATSFPGEQARSQRLLNTLESYDVESMASYRSQQAISDNGSVSGMADWFLASSTVRGESDEVLRSAGQNTPLFAMIASGPARDQLCVQDTDTECRIRATKLVLQLLQKQRESDELPTKLDEFDASLSDPWTGKPFVCYPDGLPADLKLRSEVLVEANIPFLITFRISQAFIGRVEYQDSVDAGQFDGDALEGFGFPSVASDDSENAAVLGREQADLDFARAEETTDRAPKAVGETPEAISHFEFLINGPQEFGTANVIIWQLPKNPATSDEQDSVE